MAKLVSKTYGEALFELGIDEQCLEQLSDEAFAIEQTIQKNPELLKLLNHPNIDKEEKISVVESIFKGQVSDVMVGFLVLLLQKDRYNEILSVLQYFTDRVKVYKKIGVAYGNKRLQETY